MDAHWTNNELMEKLYGAGPEEPARETHLAVCPECGARWRELEQRRARFVENARSEAVDEARLRAQREAVWKRLEETRRPWLWRAAPAGAAAALMFAALLLHTPAPRVEAPELASVQISDEQLFSEIASMVSEESPRAAMPIQGLFDAEAGMEVR